MCQVEIILDSVIDGMRITSMRLYYWRALHAEMMTYRNCARSCSSSRAIPYKVMRERLLHDGPFVPTKVGYAHKGMSPTDFLEGRALDDFQLQWMDSFARTMHIADQMHAAGVSKSIINRLLEPYSRINVLMTGTSTHWEHLIKQRTATNAEPHIQILATLIKQSYETSKPIERLIHLPFVYPDELTHKRRCDISAARCARISYTPHGSKDTAINEDIELAERLHRDGHMTPFEHQVLGNICLSGISSSWLNKGNNFTHQINFRQYLENQYAHFNN